MIAMPIATVDVTNGRYYRDAQAIEKQDEGRTFEFIFTWNPEQVDHIIPPGALDLRAALRKRFEVYRLQRTPVPDEHDDLHLIELQAAGSIPFWDSKSKWASYVKKAKREPPELGPDAGK